MALPIDLSFDRRIGEFSATEVEVSAVSLRGRAYLAELAGTCAGVAPVSVVLRKSAALDTFHVANQAGLVCSAAA
jgi:hypothetical protein